MRLGIEENGTSAREVRKRKLLSDFGPCTVAGHIPTLTWVRFRVWVGGWGRGPQPGLIPDFLEMTVLQLLYRPHRSLLLNASRQQDSSSNSSISSTSSNSNHGHSSSSSSSGIHNLMAWLVITMDSGQGRWMHPPYILVFIMTL